jgi:hypothetical protein
VGAAAFVLGLSLAGPQSAVAVADSSESAPTSDTAGPPGAADSAPQRAARAPRPTSARGAHRNADTGRAPAATMWPSAVSEELSAEPLTVQPERGTPSTDATKDIAPDPLPDRPVAPQTPAAPQALAPELSSTLAAQPDRVVAAAAPAAQQPAQNPSPPRVTAVVTVTTAAEPPAARAVPEPVPVPVPEPVPAPPGLAALTTPVGAAATSSFTDLVNGLLAPIQSLFEGAALMLRRSLFNEVPSVSPVQLTGLTEGPITGTLGAVDPEGDPLSYTVSTSPGYGTVTIGQDGSYTYTPGAGFTGADSFVVTATDTGLHINLLNLGRPAGTAANVAVTQSALSAAALRFQFLYGSGSQYWTPEARAALEAAAAKLASSVVVSSPVVITYAVTARNSPLSSTLATAGSDFVAPQAGFINTGFMNTVVQNKIQNGVDANGAAADGTIDWNMGKPWGYGNTVGSTQYDFQSIAMHELLHTFGFLSYVDAPSSNTGRIWTVYDGYLVNSAGTEVISTTYSWNPAYNTNLTGGNGGLYFSGPNAVAANNGLVSLYTPSTWTSGSSLSHLNDAVFSGSRRKLMNAVSTTGTNIRTLSPVELGILQDIGYQVSSGSGTSALMVVGFFVTRRMRRKD